MSRTTCFLTALVILLSLNACNKDNNTQNMQTMIVGKWNLQKQLYVQYVNDVKQVDTTCIASDTVYSNVQFNADKTFKSLSLSAPKSLNLSSQDDEANTSGTYTISSSSFTLSQSTGSIYFHFSNGTGTGIPVYTNVTNSAQINTITSNSLHIHTEDDYTEILNNVSTGYKITNDLYYTK